MSLKTMAYFSTLCVSLSCFLIIHSCVAASSTKMNCQVIARLMAMEPNIRIPQEAGSIEIWSLNNDLFRCAGVEVSRFTIQPNGLILPFYANSNRFSYLAQGELWIGQMIPGCSKKSYGQNQCQIIYRFKKGDMAAVKEGEIIWVYNDGDEPAICISTYRIGDNRDRIRRFFLGGPQKILQGFSLKFIINAFNIDDDLATKLQSEDLRGNIVYMNDGGLNLSSLSTTKSCSRQDQQKPKGVKNIVDESFCNKRVATISDPSIADLFIPKVGYFKTIDAHQLPVLNSVQLSATYHFLRKDVMRLPHWENSYDIIYMVKGEGYIQVVDENGKNVFDDIVKEGQILLVPKNFVMAELAKHDILEYIILKTNGNPITSNLSGRNSVIHDLPMEVVTNAYNITEEEAKNVKFNREDTSLAKIMPENI